MSARQTPSAKDPGRQARGRARKEAAIAAGLMSPDGLRYIFAGNVDAAIYIVAGRPRGVPDGLSVVKAGKAKLTTLGTRLATHRRQGLKDVLLVLPYPTAGPGDVDRDEEAAVRALREYPGATPLAKRDRDLLPDGYREAAMLPAPEVIDAAGAVLNALSP
jgi:hypothetical protein